MFKVTNERSGDISNCPNPQSLKSQLDQRASVEQTPEQRAPCFYLVNTVLCVSLGSE